MTLAAKRRFVLGFLLLTEIAASTSARAARLDDVAVVHLRTDGAEQLLGTDNLVPRFSWRLEASRRGVEQTGYEILVATSADRLRPGRADVWDAGRAGPRRLATDRDRTTGAAIDGVPMPRRIAGKVLSSEPWADYAGPRLASRTRYFWTVRVWDEKGRATEFAPPAWFETAMLSASEWRAEWIAGPERARRDGVDALLTQETVSAQGEFCRPVGTPGPLAFADEPRREEYLARAPTACRAVRPAALLRREFSVDGAVERARLYVSGLAYADVYLNGTQLGAGAVLDPGYTSYSERVLYVTYDVTEQLRRGANALGIELGSGFFDYDVPSEWSWTAADWRGDPRARAELHVELAGGRALIVSSDASWKTAEGPTRYDNINIGETHDARFAQPGWAEPGFDDRAWQPARVVAAPGGVASAQTHEPIAIVAQREPVAVSQPRDGVWVYDFGVQMTGWAEVAIEATSGVAAEIRYAEGLLPDGTVDTTRNLHIADQLQTDFLVSGGSSPLRWRPRFSYKGFRYVQVSGPRATPFEGRVVALHADVVHSAVRSTARFDSDHDLLNGIFAIVERTIANNLHGIVTDTPVYEKNGWTGDAQLTAPTAALLFDLERFYTKWLRDMRDSQRPTGEIPVIVPSGGRYGYTGVGWPSVWGATPAWDAALFSIPWDVYRVYGDERPLVAGYEAQQRYIDDWLPLWTTEHLVRSDLGDWLSPVAVLPTLVPTAYSAELTRRLAELAELLGERGDRDRYRRQWMEIRDAFNAAFFDPERHVYREAPDDPFAQAANAVALAFDLVPEDRRAAVAAAIAEDVAARGGNLATGIVGTRHLLAELTDAGSIDVAFEVATQTDRPSWGEWLDLGYTSLLEAWGPAVRSQDHHMFGSIGQWMLEDLAGIEPLEPGFGTIELRPELPSSGLDRVEASLETVRGRTAVRWQRTAGRLTLEVTVPPGATGMVHVPATSPDGVSEVGERVARPAHRADGVRLAGVSAGRVVYRVGSGSYRFEAE